MAIIWKFKSCPRCGGDIFVERDQDSWHEQCLQCGYLHDILSKAKVNQRGEKEGKKELSRQRV